MDDLLLVEDDPGQARLTQRTLERAGYALEWVATAEQCVSRVRERAPNMVLLDRGLPDGDGLDVLDAIRHRSPRICVVMLTGADDLTVAVEAMRRGAWDYVLKRPDLSHLSDLPLVLDRNRARLRLLDEHDRLNRAVRQSEQRYRELFDQASDLIVICDADGLVQEVNRAFQDLTGYAAEEVSRRPLAEFVLPTSPTHADTLRERSVRVGDGMTGELHLRTRTGQEVWLDMKTRPLVSPNGPPGFQGIGRDITERRRMEQMKADFLAMVTHDMKNPVSVITGCSEILLNDVCPSAVCREMLLSIDSSARGLLHLILNFLDLSRIEARAAQPLRVTTTIDEVLRQVIAYELPLAKAKQVAIDAQLNASMKVDIDTGQMDRVFVNLIGNAIKFSPVGGRVGVSSSLRGNGVEVHVSDTGPGIPPDQIPHLFGKYQRLSQTARTGGTGLGLFIAKSMIEAHQGTVRVESQPGQGATFIVRLPASVSPARG
jgi:PAS domain S-box-containing protein